MAIGTIQRILGDDAAELAEKLYAKNALGNLTQSNSVPFGDAGVNVDKWKASLIWRRLQESFRNMIHQPLRFVFLFVVVIAFGGSRTIMADDYVWARSNWGVLPGGTAVGKMTNGYGGYYVPRNAAGYNYEGQRFTNPNGFIIPAQAQTYSAPQPQRHRRFLDCLFPTVQQPAMNATMVATPVPPTTPASNLPAVEAPAQSVAPPPPVELPAVQATQVQQPQQPYQMTRIK